MSGNSENENAMIAGLQADGYDVWIDRRPSHQNVTIRNQRSRRRRNPCCSYCREEGHNILRCNPPEKTRVLTLVNRWLNIMDGPYANVRRDDLKNVIHQQLDQEENLSIFMLYYVVLGIRDPNSTNFQSISSSKRKITDKILNDRTDLIHRRGDRNQINQLEQDLFIERERRPRLSERSSRLRRILSLHHRIQDLENAHSVTWDLLNNSSDELAVRYQQEIQYINSLMFELNHYYFESVESYRTDYNEDPELILFMQNRLNHLADEQSRAQFVLQQRQVNLQKTIKINKQILLEDEYESWTNIDCPVCYENVKGDDICMTNCSHKFCYSCISQTLKTDKNQRCPCCRTQVDELVNKSSFIENEEMKDIAIHF